MTLFGVTLDTWAFGEGTNIATMTTQSLCLLIALILLIIRLNRMYQDIERLKSNWKIALLQSTQFIMMACSFIYLFFHFWNYIYLYFDSNPMDCGGWFISLLFALAGTRIFLFVFLMLRSTYSFVGTFCAIPLKISLSMIVFSVIGNTVPVIIVLSDFIPIQPIPGRGFCFRIVGDTAVAAATTWHLQNCVASTAAIAMFWWKSRQVSKFVKQLQSDNKMNSSIAELEYEFRKHTKLGILTVIGTIIMFFVQDTLSVLIGVSYALDQTVNNILTFIMFKEHAAIYNYVCCKNRAVKAQENVIKLSNLQQKSQTDFSTSDKSSKTSKASDIEVIIH